MHITTSSERQLSDLPGSGQTRTTGLCSTCNNIADCGYRLARGFDALFCESFDNYTPPSVKPVEPSPEFQADKGTENDKAGKPVQRPQPRTDDEDPSDKLKGLCINCEHRKDCCLPRPEGGVWHCEEYE
jgi:hypothetical protein